MTFRDPRLLALSAMARRLRVTTKWLREEAEAGRVPHLKAGPALLFDPVLTERVLLKRARQLPPTADGPPDTEGGPPHAP
jgi:hypothetical protein